MSPERSYEWLRPKIGFTDVANVLSMWATKRLSTYDIAQSLHIHEADVELIIHGDREARRAAR